MNDQSDYQTWLAAQFEQHRNRLRTIAYRMLGSHSEADDVLQEAWLRVSRTGTDDVTNLAGWLTTIVTRLSLDVRRSRRVRHEQPVGIDLAELASDQSGDPDLDPESHALTADTIGPALLAVLDILSPSERIVFILHDIFALPFDEIATVVERTPPAVRQLASRARRKISGAERPPTDPTRQRAIVDAFLAAARDGEFDTLLTLLAPNVVLHADTTAALLGAPRRLHGAAAVAHTFLGRARAARPATIDGTPALIWAFAGRPKVAFTFTIVNNRIAGIALIADTVHLEQLDISIANNNGNAGT
jgi:RNA polymerase sigma factor (sigma-70 family)